MNHAAVGASLLAKVVNSAGLLGNRDVLELFASRLAPTPGVTQILGCGKAKAGEFRHCPGLLQHSLFPLIGIYVEGIAQLLLDP